MKISKMMIFAFFISQCMANSNIDLKQENKVIQWSSSLISSINNYSYLNVDNILSNSKSKFSDKLWQNYYEKFINGDNYKRIKKYNIVVNSYSDGQALAKKTSANKWQITMPVKVIFRNEYHKLEQKRNYSLLVSSKGNSLELDNISYEIVTTTSSNNIPVIPKECH